MAGRVTEQDRGEVLLGLIYEEVDRQLNPNNDDCWHCGGEGVVFDCFDGFCVDADSGCDQCTRSCIECKIFAGQRAKAIREEVIKSGDITVAKAWLKSLGRLTPDITDERIQKELDACRAILSEGKA